MRNKGITLIALVITVIVLLILAGISISMLSGNNSILSRAGQAKDESVVGQEKEQVELAYVSVAVNKLGNDVTDDELQIELNKSVGDRKTDVSKNEDNTLNVYFIDTEHNYNINKGIVSKVETEEEIIAMLLQYFQNDWWNEEISELSNIEPITDATSSIEVVYRVFDSGEKLVCQYIYYKGKCFEVTLNNEFKAINVESKSKYALILDSEQKMEIIPQTNLTWYDWASDVDNTQDLTFKFGKSDEEISLKELIIKVHDDYYNNSSDNKSIEWGRSGNTGWNYMTLTDREGNWQNFDLTIKQNEVYTITRGIM